jgi:hypothetical protein
LRSTATVQVWLPLSEQHHRRQNGVDAKVDWECLLSRFVGVRVIVNTGEVEDICISCVGLESRCSLRSCGAGWISIFRVVVVVEGFDVVIGESFVSWVTSPSSVSE